MTSRLISNLYNNKITTSVCLLANRRFMLYFHTLLTTYDVRESIEEVQWYFILKSVYGLLQKVQKIQIF